MKTLLVMAGGTGGHIFPGLAVAEMLRARGWRVVWMGNPEGMEARLVPQQGYETAWVHFGALRGKGWGRKLMLPWNLFSACARAWRELRRIRPDVVLGMGGYITFPGGLMAVLCGLPLLLHEQNSVAGLANRVLARVATRVLSGFPDVLPGAHWVGNPVRDRITALTDPAQRLAGRSGPLRLLVVGGSLGAAVLNQVVPRALALMPAASRPQVVHQSGETQIDALRAAYAEVGVEADLRPFIDDMAGAYAGADLVICRAGALTVAELAAVGVASVLVPLPHAVDDHQTANARFLAEHDAACLLPQNELNAERLAGILASMDRQRLAHMAGQARSLARPDADREVARHCVELAGGGQT